MKQSRNIFLKGAYAITVILLGLLFGCQQNKVIAHTDQEMDSLVDRMMEFNKTWNPDLLDEIYADDIIYHGPDGSPDIEGIRLVKWWIMTNKTAYPDANIAVDEMIVKGDRIVVRYTFTGTNTGPRGYEPGTGKFTKGHGVHINRVVNGKIHEVWDFWNNLDFLRQLGYHIYIWPPIAKD